MSHQNGRGIFIKLWMDEIRQEYFRDDDLFRFRIWSLLKAKVQSGPVKFGRFTVDCPRGSFVTSISEGAQELNISEKQFRRCLASLPMIQNKNCHSLYRVIIVTDYEDFQGIPADPICEQGKLTDGLKGKLASEKKGKLENDATAENKSDSENTTTEKGKLTEGLEGKLKKEKRASSIDVFRNYEDLKNVGATPASVDAGAHTGGTPAIVLPETVKALMSKVFTNDMTLYLSQCLADFGEEVVCYGLREALRCDKRNNAAYFQSVAASHSTLRKNTPATSTAPAPKHATKKITGCQSCGKDTSSNPILCDECLAPAVSDATLRRRLYARYFKKVPEKWRKYFWEKTGYVPTIYEKPTITEFTLDELSEEERSELKIVLEPAAA